MIPYSLYLRLEDGSHVGGFRDTYFDHMGFPRLGGPYWDPYYKGVLLFGGLQEGPLIFVNPPEGYTDP